MDGITFCFLVTKDLVKEHIWREWFNELRRLKIKYRILTHCSYPEKITSPWLRATLIPKEYIKETSWQYHSEASLSLYRYAKNMTNSCWYTFHSESCIPLISPQKFIEYYNTYKNNTLMSYCKIWWDPKKMNRANLHLFPEELHYANQEWVVLCREDLESLINLSENNKELTYKIISGPGADESLVSVFLKITNNFINTINTQTTLVDWERTPNGNNPHTFIEWTEKDIEIVEKNKKKHKDLLFLRKIGDIFPDDELRRIIFTDT